MKPVISLYAASKRNDDAYVAALLWRASPILLRVKQAVVENSCGELRSLRFTWSRPKKRASGSADFVYGTLGAMLDGVCALVGGDCRSLHIEKCEGANILFALAEFTGGVVAEFELNECLPDSMPDICFVKANFTDGHLTNQPLVGYLNDEGAIFADDESLRFPMPLGNGELTVEGPVEYLGHCFKTAVQSGTIPCGAQNSARLIKLIDVALTHAEN